MSMRAISVIMLMAACLAACLAPAPSPTFSPRSSPAATVPASSAATDAPKATSSATPGSSPLPPVATDPPPLALDVVAEGLASPIGISAAPDGWLLINEQAGRVVAVHPERGERATVLDISDRVSAGGERGLLGLALHPDWPQVGRAFVHYSDVNGDTVLAEFAGAQDADAAPMLDAGSETRLLGVPQPNANHNGGQLAFGPDGFLYFGLGDGGGSGDPGTNGQNPATLLGSILRLDIDAVPDDGNYGIPEDNPFADDFGDSAGLPDVFLFGLRNPWRFSFDTATGELWIADVGQNAYEEVNRVDPATDAGANLGWNIMEASHCFLTVDCSTEGLTLPLAEYELGGGNCSVTGGYVYRGEATADLFGWYVFGDYCSGRLFGVASDAQPRAVGETVEPRVMAETGFRISAFGQGGDGELYVADHAGGRLYRIVPGD